LTLNVVCIVDSKLEFTHADATYVHQSNYKHQFVMIQTKN